jgi:DNA-binding NarL/FixJ family response regulator
VEVLIVDDDDDMRELMRLLVEIANRGLRVQGVAADGDEAVARWRRERPDVIVMDHRMPTKSGLDAAAEILAEDPDAQIFLVTAFDNHSLRAEAVELGVLGVFAKDEGFDSLVPALHALAR